MAVGAIAGGTIMGGLISSKGASDAAKTAAKSSDAAAQLQYEMFLQQREDLAPWREAGTGALNALWGTSARPEQVIKGAPIYGTAGAGQAYGQTGPWYDQSIIQGADGQLYQKVNVSGDDYNPVYIPVGQPTPMGGTTYYPMGGQMITGYQPDTIIPATPGTQGLIQKGPGEFTESPSYQFALSEGLKAQQRAASATGRLGSGAYLKDATQYAKNLASEEYQNFLNRYYQSLEPYFRIAGFGTSTANALQSASQNYATQAGNYMTQAGQAQAAGQLGQGNTLANMFNWGGQQAGNYLYQQQLQKYMPPGMMFPAYGGVNSTTYGYMSPNQMNQMAWL